MIDNSISARQTSTDETGTDPIETTDEVAASLGAVRHEIGRVVLGQQDVVDQVLVTLISGGHGLLVGLPGLAKTLLVETLGTVLGLNTKRVQFTPDLLPADILGSEILDRDEDGKRHFRFVEGPVFCQLLMADEINRASPRTQSALLQAMQEGQVSVAGSARALPTPFHVLATQNPIEQEGTYPLPEAQLDRFFMQINVTYPDLNTERDMLLATTGVEKVTPKQILDAAGLRAAQQAVRALPVGEKIVDTILTLVRLARPDTDEGLDLGLEWGPGPRAAQALMLATRSRSLLNGRYAPSIDDVVALAPGVLRHRMALGFAARMDGRSIETVIDELIGRL